MNRRPYARYFINSIYIEPSFIGSRGEAFKSRNESVKCEHGRHNDE